MNPLILDDADCILPVTIKVGANEVTQELDVAKVQAELSAISKKAGTDNVAWLRGVVDYLQTLGFPQASYTTARRFAEGINDALGELKKKDGDSKKAA